MITENTYERLTAGIRDAAERVTLRLLTLQAEFARRMAKDPDGASRYRLRFDRGRQAILNDWNGEIQSFANKDLPVAYIAGVKDTNAHVKRIGVTAGPDNPIPNRQIMAGRLYGTGFTDTATARLFASEGISKHLTAFSVFRAAAVRELEGTLRPIIRSTDDIVRGIVIESGNAVFRESAVTTRVTALQDFMQRAADRGVTSVVYRRGRTVPLDVYGEMAGRTLMGKAATQATINRGAEFGSDLIQVSEHQDPSDLCAPYQGRVFSVSGNSDRYPPFQEALDGGLYHPNCRHSVTDYWPGIAEESERSVDPAVQKLYDTMGEKRGEAFAYKQTQRQRNIENTIRRYKRREAGAITTDAADKAGLKVREWQKKQRDHLEEHSFLRRRWSREQIK